MRHLASVQVVHGLEPIEGADRIEIAKVLGWQCVVAKGKFSKGDKAVYFEIDSFLPERGEFEFLRSSSFKNSDVLGPGFKLKTQKFRGSISQGLLMSLEELGLSPDIEVGTDVTERLGVRQWEIAERATSSGKIIGTLPDFIPKTDETRIQSCAEVIDEFGDKAFYISTKMDGTSCSVGMDEGGNIRVTGHNYEYGDGDEASFFGYVGREGIRERVLDYAKECRERGNGFKTLTIQGEYCGMGIQKNRLKLDRPEWFVFTVIKDGERLGYDDFVSFCDQMNLTHVPIEEVGKDFKFCYPTVESLLVRACGEYPKGGPKEGIVVRPCEPCYSQLLHAPLSFKVINNKFLLKYSD